MTAGHREPGCGVLHACPRIASRPRLGRSRHLPPPNCGDVRDLPLDGQPLSQAPQPDRLAGSQTHSWSHAHQGRRLSYRPACPVGRHHDFTLEQHCKLWASSHGVQVSTASMSRAIARLGWTRKKTDGCRRAQRNRPYGLVRPRSLPPSRAPDLARRLWRPHRAYPALCQSTQRAVGLWLGACNRGENITLIAGLSLSGMLAPLILEGLLNTLAFEAYVEQVLAPSLTPGQIVVLDNLSAHTGQRVRQAITERGVRCSGCPRTRRT
jgi:hypothetical protein